jgi:ppGpp synthetase/RelA/SpoT-type nucleotidyltranferase
MATEAEFELLLLLNAAQTIRPRIEAGLFSHAAFAEPIYRINSRIKTPRRAFDKLSRLRIERPAAVVSDVNDLMGFRIVTLFSTSVIYALEIVLDAIDHKGQFAQNSLFIEGERKIVIYSARPDTDTMSIKRNVKQWLESRQGDKIFYEDYTSETLYSSIHVIAACLVQIESTDGLRKEVSCPVEIQIRTAMEDV